MAWTWIIFALISIFGVWFLQVNRLKGKLEDAQKEVKHVRELLSSTERTAEHPLPPPIPMNLPQEVMSRAMTEMTEMTEMLRNMEQMTGSSGSDLSSMTEMTEMLRNMEQMTGSSGSDLSSFVKTFGHKPKPPSEEQKSSEPPLTIYDHVKED